MKKKKNFKLIKTLYEIDNNIKEKHTLTRAKKTRCTQDKVVRCNFWNEQLVFPA